MYSTKTGEKKPAEAGIEEVAERIASRARTAFRLAELHPVGSNERRFIEHGAVCYFNCWAMLKEAQGASVSPLSATPEVQ